MRKSPVSASLLGLVGAVAIVAAAGCTPRVDSRGHLPDSDLLSQIKPGEYSRDQVADLLGTPSAVATFDDEAWYYISKRTETVAFFEPKVVEQKVIIVRFDAKGVVKAVENLDLEDGKEVHLVERKTPTVGKELNIIQQLMGNLGRFSKEKGGGGAPGGE